MKNLTQRLSLFGTCLLLWLPPVTVSAQETSDQLDEPSTTRSIINQLQFKGDAPAASSTTRSLVITRGAKVVMPEPEAAEDSGAAQATETSETTEPATETVAVETESSTEPAAEVATVVPSINLRIQFELNSFNLTPDARKKLELLGEAISSEELSSYRFLIAGHTDASGSASYNQSLSERRAEAVKFYLAARFPASGSRLISQGFGEQALFDTQAPNAAVNRRVQIINLGTDN
ncbi:MAG: OmpA family protein [Alphaproteobacteria bacterium]